jgi:hypothetical protein
LMGVSLLGSIGRSNCEARIARPGAQRILEITKKYRPTDFTLIR